MTDTNLFSRLLLAIAILLGVAAPAVAQAPYSNPSSTLTLPATTTAYTANNLIATTATAANVAVPFITINAPTNGAAFPRLELFTNDATSTAWGTQTIQVDLWTVAPTFTNGDRGAFAVATGTAGHKASFACTMGSVNGDGVYGECSLITGTITALTPAKGQTGFWWTLKATTGSGVTGASKVFTLVAETVN